MVLAAGGSAHVYDSEPYRHVSLIDHRGAVIAFAMSADRRIVYSVRRKHEVPGRFRWPEDPASVPFPDEIERIERPAPGAPNEEPEARQTSGDSGTGQFTADAPFQVSCDNHHVYVFRQSLDATLLVDRFVLSGSELSATRELRYRRSRRRTRPAPTKGDTGSKDSLGYRDMDGKPFVEPTRELAFVNDLSPGNFTVLLLPTQIPGISRWQIFAAEARSSAVRSINLERSADGLFDPVGTPLYTSPDPRYRGAVLERRPGTCPFTRQKLVEIENGSAMSETHFVLHGRVPAGGLAAGLYFEKEEAEATEDCERQPRVLLALSTKVGDSGPGTKPFVAALDFAVSPTGHLAEVPSGKQLAQRAADEEFARQEVARQDEIREARQELARMEERLPPEGPGLAVFFTGEEQTGFSFTLYIDSADPDVHARFVTASRPVEGGPAPLSVEGPRGASEPEVTPSAEGEPTAQEGSGAGTAVDPGRVPGTDDEEAVVDPTSVDPAADRVRFVQLGNEGIVVELYTEPELGGTPIVMTRSGPVPSANGRSVDVRSIKVFEDPEVARLREQVPAKRKALDDLEQSAEDMRDQYERRREEIPGSEERRVLLPLVDPGEVAVDSDAAIAELSELQREQPGIEREIDRLDAEITRVDGELTAKEAGAQQVTGLRQEVTALEQRVRDLDTALVTAELSHNEAFSPRVWLLDGRRAVYTSLSAGSERSLKGDRPAIRTVEVDHGLKATFWGKKWGLFKDTDVSWSATRTTSNLPDWTFERVGVEWTRAQLDLQRSLSGELRSARTRADGARRELDQKRAALVEAEQVHADWTDLRTQRTTAVNERNAKHQRLVQIKRRLSELRSERFGQPPPLALEHHSTDLDGLTVRSGLLGFAWSGDQPVLLDSGTGLTKLFFTGTNGQLFTAAYDHRCSRAVWHLGAADATIELRSKRSGRPGSAVTISVAAGRRPELCDVTIVDEAEGTLEIWRDVSRDAQQFAEAINGPSAEAPITVPPARDHSRGSLAVSVTGTPANREVSDGVAELVAEASSPTWVTDHPGTACQFDGLSSHLASGEPDRLSHGGRVTLEAWTQPLEVRADAHVISAAHTTAGSYSLGFRSVESADSYRVWAEVDGHEILTDSALDVGSWHHVAAVYERSHALRFSGDDHAIADSATVLDLAGDLTIEVFLQIDQIGARQGIVAKGAPGRGNAVPYALSIDEQGHLVFEFDSGGAASTLRSTAPIPAGVPTRIAVVRALEAPTDDDGSQVASVTFVIDGETAGAETVGVPGPVGGNSDPLHLGKVVGADGSDSYLVGVIRG